MKASCVCCGILLLENTYRELLISLEVVISQLQELSYLEHKSACGKIDHSVKMMRDKCETRGSRIKLRIRKKSKRKKIETWKLILQCPLVDENGGILNIPLFCKSSDMAKYLMVNKTSKSCT